MRSFRTERVSALIAEIIGELLTSGEIKDPRVSSLASVSHVKVSNDCGYAKVFISSLEGAGRLDLCVAGLNNAAGFIQSVLARRMKIRLTPVLTFVADDSIQESFRINQLIKEQLQE